MVLNVLRDVLLVRRVPNCGCSSAESSQGVVGLRSCLTWHQESKRRNHRRVFAKSAHSSQLSHRIGIVPDRQRTSLILASNHRQRFTTLSPVAGRSVRRKFDRPTLVSSARNQHGEPRQYLCATASTKRRPLGTFHLSGGEGGMAAARRRRRLCRCSARTGFESPYLTRPNRK